MKAIKFSLTLMFALVIAFLCSNYGKADYQASFGGTSFQGLTRSSTIAEYDGTVDASGNLLDISGSNYVLNSDAFNNASWTVNSTASIVANSVFAPDGTLTADTLKEYGSGGGGGVGDQHYLYTTSAISSASGFTYTFSVQVKAGVRNWVGVGIYDNTVNKYFLWSFDVLNNTIGGQITTGLDGEVKDKYMVCDRGWCRCSVEMVATGVNNLYPEIFVLNANQDVDFVGLDQVSLYIANAQLSKVDAWRKGPGIYHPTTATNKPLHDLAPSGSPGSFTSYFQGLDGNRLVSPNFVTGSSQKYSVAHHDSMNIFDTSNTITLVAKAGTDVTKTVFSHIGNGGTRIYRLNTSDTWKMGNYTSGGSEDCTISLGSSVVGEYNVLQTVKNGTYITAYRDGVITESSVCPSVGVDVSATWYVGSDPNNLYWDGDVLYLRVDAEALTRTEIDKSREKIQGTLGSIGGNLYPNTTFTRATSASVPFTNRTVGYVASGNPRVVDGYLGESTSSNVAVQSKTIGTTWTASKVTVETDSSLAIAPDGTQTAEVLHEVEEDTTHMFYQSGPAATGTYTLSAWFKYMNRAWAMLYLNRGGTKGAYFNIKEGYTGTKTAGVTSDIKCGNSGWCRAYLTYTTDGAIADFGVNVASADNVNSFLGVDQDAFAVWEVQLEASPVMTSNITTTTASVQRNGDLFKVDPFKYTDSLPIGGETTWLTFDQDPTASSSLSNEGSYTWTTTGTKKKITTEQHGNGWYFDGTSVQYWKASEAAFTPTGDFSIVAAFIPETPPTTYGYIFGKYNTTSERSYSLYINQTGGVTFALSADGTQATFASRLLTGYVVGRPTFVVATYDYSDNPSGANPTGDSIGKLYINDQTVVTDNGFVGPAKPNTENVFIGRSANGSRFQGRILYLAYYNGRILSPTEVSDMYTTFKQGWVLPKQLSATDPYSKLYMNFDYQYALASAPATGYPGFVDISNTYGNSTYQKNRLYCYPVTTAFRCSLFTNGSTTEKYIEVTGLDHSTKHSVQYYLDMASIANSTMTVDGVAGTPSGMSGTTAVLNFKDSNLKFGANSLGTVDDTPNLNGKISNVSIIAKP